MSFLLIPRLLGILVIAYTFVLSFRILASWFRQSVDDKLFYTLTRITDPYLALFRNMKFLRTATFDYSPIFGIAVLIVLSNILLAIATSGTISLAVVLLIILSTVSSSLLWIILFIIILCLVRFLSIVLRKNQKLIIWTYIDSILQPVLIPVLKFFQGRPEYPRLLITTILALICLLITGFLVVKLLFSLILLIPF